jgi:exodeoxyribonuclease VII small subunit
MTATDVAGLSFEEALKELEGIVGRLEQGQVPLEESIAIYERGDALRAHCDRLLRAAEAKVEKIRLSADGQPKGTEPLDPE